MTEVADDQVFFLLFVLLKSRVFFPLVCTSHRSQVLSIVLFLFSSFEYFLFPLFYQHLRERAVRETKTRIRLIPSQSILTRLVNLINDTRSSSLMLHPRLAMPNQIFLLFWRMNI